MCTILPHAPKGGHPTVYIGNTHQNNLTQCKAICNFCCPNVINQLLLKLKSNPSGIVFFEKNGKYYRLYGGPNRSQLPGKYTFHVYIYNIKGPNGQLTPMQASVASKCASSSTPPMQPSSSTFPIIQAINYVDFCEQLFQIWYSNHQNLNGFSQDFQIEHLPEPYFIVQDPQKPQIPASNYNRILKNDYLLANNDYLYVLNYNPGQGLPRQLWQNIHANFPTMPTYQDVAAWMAAYYSSPAFQQIAPIPYARNINMLNFAYAIGMNGVVNVETFFLHSPALNKHIFLKSYSQNNVVVQYTQLLKAHLTNKTVLAIAAIGSNATINRSALTSNIWINYLCNLMGLNLDVATILPVTTRNGKTTSAIVVDRNKILAVIMGSNSLPIIPPTIYGQIRQTIGSPTANPANPGNAPANPGNAPAKPGNAPAKPGNTP